MAYRRANIPAFKPQSDRGEDPPCPESDLLVWSPASNISEARRKSSISSQGFSLPSFSLIFPQQCPSLFSWRRRSMDTRRSRPWRCCSGTNMTWTQPYRIWETSLPVLTSGARRTRSTSRRRSGSTGSHSGASDRCCPTRATGTW